VLYAVLSDVSGSTIVHKIIIYLILNRYDFYEICAQSVVIAAQVIG
jgi:hypothetical protein